MNGSINAVTNNIQIALAPVFLLSAVATLIVAITARLARSVDRMRYIQSQVLAPGAISEHLIDLYLMEFKECKKRARLCTAAILFIVMSGIFISLTVLELFIFQARSELIQTQYVVLSFVLGLAAFVISLVLVLIEVIYAYCSTSWELLNKAVIERDL